MQRDAIKQQRVPLSQPVEYQLVSLIMTTPAAAASVVPALTDRPIKNTIVLFDVDGTLTPARRVSKDNRKLYT